MNLSYYARLFCLALGVFFVLHLVLGCLVSLLTPAALRTAERIRPHLAARLLFTLRVFPLLTASMIVAAVVIPGYLWFEPELEREHIAAPAILAALAGLGLWLASSTRAALAVLDSARRLRKCLRFARRLHSQPSSVWQIPGESPFLALAGILRPQLLVSDRLLRSLPRPQLEAALQHERAHQAARDNLKRLVLLSAPGLFPACRGMDALDRGWARFAERAADDLAAAGDPDTAVSLAEALVRVSRMGAMNGVSPLSSSLIGDQQELARRVERLLDQPVVSRQPEWAVHALVATTVGVPMFLAAVPVLWFDALRGMFTILERMLH